MRSTVAFPVRGSKSEFTSAFTLFQSHAEDNLMKKFFPNRSLWWFVSKNAVSRSKKHETIC
uniref:Uncharacterized protein n=1 Tax=Elaeophora elaphi TaxID=1147741 RepID=A0A0R3S0Z0_9BILA